MRTVNNINFDDLPIVQQPIDSEPIAVYQLPPEPVQSDPTDWQSAIRANFEDPIEPAEPGEDLPTGNGYLQPYEIQPTFAPAPIDIPNLTPAPIEIPVSFDTPVPIVSNIRPASPKIQVAPMPPEIEIKPANNGSGFDLATTLKNPLVIGGLVIAALILLSGGNRE